MALIIAHQNSGGSNSAASSFGISGTWVAGDLLVCIVAKSSSPTDDGGVTDNASDGGAWTFIRKQTVTTAVNRDLLVYVRTLLAPAGTFTTTYASTDAWTSIKMITVKVTGMSLLGAAAVRGQGGQQNVSAGTPATTFDGSQACLTTNGVIGVVVNSSVAPILTEPAGGWTEIQDFSTASPMGCEAASINSGFTGSTVTWGSASGSIFCSVVIELDASSSFDAAIQTTPAVGMLMGSGGVVGREYM